LHLHYYIRLQALDQIKQILRALSSVKKKLVCVLPSCNDGSLYPCLNGIYPYLRSELIMPFQSFLCALPSEPPFRECDPHNGPILTKVLYHELVQRIIVRYYSISYVYTNY
jgi:hypothetical protein